MAEAEGERYAALWQPIRVGATQVRNRIVDPAKTVLYGEDNIISDRHIAYYAERAKGGVGLMMTEQQGAHPIAKGSFHMGCTVWEKRAIPQLEKLADAVHEHGAAIFVQLYSPGIHDKGTLIVDDWHPVWGATRIPSSIHNATPVVMGRGEIRDLIAGYAQSASNVRISGIDGVEIHAAHSYQIAQFLSPYYNRRDDAYGGTPEQRCRLALEIAEAIRAAVGPDFTVGIRLSFDEFLGEAGLTPEASEIQLGVLADSGLFDYFNITGGAYPSMHISTGGMRVPYGHMVDYGRRAKRVVGERAVVMVGGRIKTLALAHEVVARGDADMVTMGRAHFADPMLVRKAREGRETETTVCIAIKECLGRLFDQQEVTCALNPVTARERQWGDGTLVPVAAREARDVWVVGAGPAGLKCATVAARRGHRVTLFEASSEVGGHMAVMRRLPHRAEWGDGVDSFARQADAAGVVLRTGTRIDAPAVAGGTPAVVVVATGARWDGSGISAHRPDRGPLPGAAQANVLDLGTAITLAVEDPRGLGDRVIIADETGVDVPLALAELLASAGVSVEVVSPRSLVGEEMYRTREIRWVATALREQGAGLRAQWLVEAIEGDVVHIAHVWTQERERLAGVDTLVLSMLRIPDDDLLTELARDGSPRTIAVGDALAPRSLAEVVYDGEKVGRAL